LADLQAQLQGQPGDPQVLYQVGLLLAAIQPDTASTYLRQAAQGSPELAATAMVVDRSLRVAGSVGDPAYSYLLAGRALASIGEWDLAAEAFHRATQARPGWAEAWAFLGEARQRLPSGAQGRAQAPAQADQDALQALEKALALDPTSLAANVFMALYWQRHQRLDTALSYLQGAAAADPQNPALQAEIGNFLAEAGDLPKAESFYERATQLAPQDPLYWRILAEFSIRYGGQIRQLALPAARQAVILSPHDPAALDVMGQALFLLGDYDSAGRFLLRAVQSDPGYAPAHLHLGMNALMLGQSSFALQQLTLAGALAPQTPVADQAQRLLQRYFP
jgi:tetratricopeptide (TPR) repeat protein